MRPWIKNSIGYSIFHRGYSITHDFKPKYANDMIWGATDRKWGATDRKPYVLYINGGATDDLKWRKMLHWSNRGFSIENAIFLKKSMRHTQHVPLTVYTVTTVYSVIIIIVTLTYVSIVIHSI